MRTRVKICGITRQQDALTAVEHGVDALGFVFYPPSPRSVSIQQAAAIRRELPPFVTTVALFVNADAQSIREVVEATAIDLIQFHGNECPAYCAQHARPWMRAIRMKEDTDLDKMATDFAAASGLLLDAYRAGVPGGTGETFDWQRIPRSHANRIVLAGGLSPGNIAQAIRQVRPYGVDVSGGVEVEKGIKDSEKIARFMHQVRAADNSSENS